MTDFFTSSTSTFLLAVVGGLFQRAQKRGQAPSLDRDDRRHGEGRTGRGVRQPDGG